MNNRLSRVAACLSLILTCFPAIAQAATNQQTIMGWVDTVYVESIDSRFKAKLDTGATTSSMRADVLKVLDEAHPDARRVVFQVENDAGETSTLERKLIRHVRIKMKDGGWQRRPVVEMDFCIAGRHVISEVNLAPREDFIYPVLVGRNMLRDAGIIVDPARTFTAPARCVGKTPHTEDEDVPARVTP